MPSGDRSRTWFPEMIHELRQAWRGDLGMEELIALAQRLDRQLHDIRKQWGIRPPTMRCPKCGKLGPVAAPRVSVRATILAAARFGLGVQADIKQLERLWNRRRAKEGLDLYGNPAGARARTEPCNCADHDSQAGDR